MAALPRVPAKRDTLMTVLSSMLATVLALLGSPSAPALAAAQTTEARANLEVEHRGPRVETLEEYAYHFRYQPAEEALAFVRPLLSERGSVELQPGRNTLVVFDGPSRLSAIADLLREFDHPPRAVTLELQILRASRNLIGPSGDPTYPPPELAQRLGKMLRYNGYQILAHGEVGTLEGRNLTYEIGGDFVIRFGVGTVLENRRLKLSNFQVLQRSGDDLKVMLTAHFNVWLNRTLALAFARDEDDETALVVAVTPTAVAE